MKKVKFTLLALGVLLILISAFLNYSSQLEFVNNEEETRERFEIGVQHPSWYVFTILTAILFKIGFFSENNLGNKITFYTLLPIFTFLSGGFALIQTATWGATPFIPHYELGMTINLIGCIVILAAAIISLHRPKRKEPNYSSNLLDQD